MSKGNFLFGTVRGKLGDMVLYRAKSEQRSRTYLGSGMISNPKTYSQMLVRVQLANLVNFYRQCRTLLMTSFCYKKRNQTDYNAFVSRNLNKTSVYLTKTEAENATSVVAPYIISYGPLTSIEVTSASSSTFITNISVGDLEIDDSTTVATVASYILANNQAFQEGARISYASFIQNTSSETGYPYVTLGLYQFDLDTTDSTNFRTVFPEFCSTITDGYIGTGSTLAAGGFAYIYSYRDEEGTLKCSTQRIVLNNSLYDNYSSDTQLSAALEAYDAQSDSVLSSESEVDDSTVAVAVSINSVTINGTTSTTGSDSVKITEGVSMTINGNALSSITSVTLYTSGYADDTITESTITSFDDQESNYITFTVPSGVAKYLYQILLNGIKYASFTLPDDDDDSDAD